MVDVGESIGTDTRSSGADASVSRRDPARRYPTNRKDYQGPVLARPFQIRFRRSER